MMRKSALCDRRRRSSALVEPLEVRRLFAAVTVTNLASTVNGDTSSIANLIAHPGSDGISFAEALTAANNTLGADSILFPASFNLGTINVANLTITDSVTIQGPASGTVNFIGLATGPQGDFQGGGRILSINSGLTASINDITFEDGDATDPTQTTTHDAFGGAIENAGSLTVKNCVFYNNGAGDASSGIGGGGAIYNIGVLNLDSSSFFENETLGGSGGGIDNGGTAIVTNSTFYMNLTSGRGGAFANAAGHTMTIGNCTIFQNGGAPVILIPNPSSDNIANFGVMILNNSIVSNKLNGNDVFNSGTISGSHNLIKDGSGGSTLIGTITSDPKLQAPFYFAVNPNYQNGNIPSPANGGAVFTFAPLAGSPCIDAGDNSKVTTYTDGRDVARVNNSTVDIGAVETGASFSIQVTTLTDEDNGTIDPAAGTGTSLREALDVDAPGALTITFASSLAGTIELNSGLTKLPNDVVDVAYTGSTNGVATNTSIVGGGKITLDGQNKSTVLTLAGGSISGVSFINGHYGGPFGSGGGAISGNALTITNCSFINNTSTAAAGAVYSSGSTFVDCTFSGNSATYYGGAIYEETYLDVIQNCTFTGNSSANGGAVVFGYYYVNGEGSRVVPIIQDSTFSGNTATNVGGAIDVFGYDSDSPALLGLVNCTIVNNSATNNGGGVLNTGTVYLTHCTVYGNSVTNAASGSLVGAGVATIPLALDQRGSITSLNNNIIAGNTGGADVVFESAESDSQTGSHNLIGDGSGGLPDTVTGNPMLGPLQNNGGPTQTMALLPGSPAINAGSNALAVDANGIAVTTDQRGPGFLRIAGGGVDAGAYQLQSSTPWLAAGSQANWNASNHTLVVTGTATIIADPGTDEPQITFTGSNDLLKIQTAGNIPVHLGGLSLTNSATARVISPVKPDVLIVSPAPGLAIDSSSQVDLGNSDLIVQSGNASQIFGYLKAGFSSGKWNGLGSIVSSNSKTDSTHLTALAMLANSSAGYAMFDSVPVVNSDVLVKYAYYGDANLDGKADGSDYSLIDSGYLTQATGWSNGDFNYDGVINGSDYTLIDNAFNMQRSPIAGPAAQIVRSMTMPSAAPPATSSLAGQFHTQKSQASGGNFVVKATDAFPDSVADSRDILVGVSDRPPVDIQEDTKADPLDIASSPNFLIHPPTIDFDLESNFVVRRAKDPKLSISLTSKAIAWTSELDGGM